MSSKGLVHTARKVPREHAGEDEESGTDTDKTSSEAGIKNAQAAEDEDEASGSTSSPVSRHLP